MDCYTVEYGQHSIAVMATTVREAGRKAARAGGWRMYVGQSIRVFVPDYGWLTV